MTEQDDINAEFSFVVVKTKDGKYAIGNLEASPRQPTLDEVYTSLHVILRDLQSNHTAATLLQALSQVQNGGQQQTPGGVVVPKAKFQKVERAR